MVFEKNGEWYSSRTAMTADYVIFHAAERPNAVAFFINGREFTYADFARDIRKFTRALREFELPRGAKVAIDVGGVYYRWLLRLAFERLCVVTALFDTGERLIFPHTFDLVLSEKKFYIAGVRRQWEITPQWLDGILAEADTEEEPIPAIGPDDPFRIVFTSGTTGTVKKLLYSRLVHEASVAKMMWFANFTRQSRYLFKLGTVAAPTACIRAGGTLVIDNRVTAGEVITSHAVTHTMLPPIMLKNILDELPCNFAKPSNLRIFSSGATLSETLRDRARVRLATNVWDLYGTYEAGYVSSIKDDAEFGSIWPGVQVEVVNDSDEPLPLGEVGQIRVKTDCMVQGYLDDPKITEQMFKDGWFYAKDLGILHSGCRLEVIGRSDEVFNIGGAKFSPDAIENIVLKTVEVDDVGACSVQNPDGIEEIYIAVSGGRIPEQELLERIISALDLPFKIHISKLDRIPRNANGKIERSLLKRGFSWTTLADLKANRLESGI